jgi:hypothetical protein
MQDTAATVPTREAFTLPASGTQAISIQIVLLFAASFVLPAAAHATGLPVRMLLPMHWPVILAGLCYGGRSGAVVGLSAPILSFLLSGMPLPHILPSMTIELAAYGLLAGFARGYLKLNWFAATAVSLIGGRIVFLAIVFTTRAVPESFLGYLQVAMLPGIWAALAQLILLSIGASWWVGRQPSSRV